MLSRYRSGKIPKAFKVLPRLKNWRGILELTHPETWTPNATYQATRIFISGLRPKLAEEYVLTSRPFLCHRFLSDIILPKIRHDIALHKKLNSHYYETLKKSIYKPEAFFKGIILTLCEQPDVTLKEATIIASVLAKMSIPVLHSAAALLKLAQQEYSGPRSIFIKTLLDKRYALPQRAVDSMVAYFCRFERCEQKLPVLWHQSLLVFAQRYKNDLDLAQRTDLFNLLDKNYHEQISAEIARELEAGAINQGQVQ